MTDLNKFNKTNLHLDFEKALKANRQINKEYDTLQRKINDAKKKLKQYQISKKYELEKKRFNILDIKVFFDNDPTYKKLLNQRKQNSTIFNCNLNLLRLACKLSAENLAKAVHNIMIFEIKENIDILNKYEPHYKRYKEAFTLGRFTGTYYYYGNVNLDTNFIDQYLNIVLFYKEGNICLDFCNEYKILDDNEIINSIKYAAAEKDKIIKRFNKLKDDIELFNREILFTDLKINELNSKYIEPIFYLNEEF